MATQSFVKSSGICSGHSSRTDDDRHGLWDMSRAPCLGKPIAVRLQRYADFVCASFYTQRARPWPGQSFDHIAPSLKHLPTVTQMELVASYERSPQFSMLGDGDAACSNRVADPSVASTERPACVRPTIPITRIAVVQRGKASGARCRH